MEMESLESLTSQLEKTSLEEPFEQKYVLEQTLDTSKVEHITHIRLNFYQLWALFRVVPCISESNRNRLYEYKIRPTDGSGDVFTIYIWSKKGQLFKEMDWNIGSTCTELEDIQNFLEYLFDALNVYSQMYKCIENGVFKSNNEMVNRQLQSIRSSLLYHREFFEQL